MLKITINSFKDKLLTIPMVVFVSVRINVDTVGNRLICGFDQSDTQDQKERFDWLQIGRSAVIVDNPTLPAKTADLQPMAEGIIKDWITSLNLPQVKLIETI